jgi:hypothetical protein
LLPVWVKGGSSQLRYEVENLRREVLQLHAAADKELGPFPLPTMVATVSASSAAAPVVQPSGKLPQTPVAPAIAGAINLLPLIDPEKDAVAGQWKLSADGLALVSPKGVTVLELPYAPPEEYDFEIEFTPRNDGMNVNQYLVAAGHPFAWKLIYGFDLLDGKRAVAGRTEAKVQKMMPIKTGQRCTSRVEVRRGSLRALINGEESLLSQRYVNRISWLWLSGVSGSVEMFESACEIGVF